MNREALEKAVCENGALEGKVRAAEGPEVG